MSTQTLTLKDHPFVRQLLTNAIGYRKHKASFSVFSHPVRVNSYWDGGSRDEFSMVQLATQDVTHLPASGSHPFFDVERRGLANQSNSMVDVDGAGNVYLKVLPPGWALIQHGTFCGKPATAHVYANREDLIPALEP